jgi:hypothetical protein
MCGGPKPTAKLIHASASQPHKEAQPCQTEDENDGIPRINTNASGTHTIEPIAFGSGLDWQPYPKRGRIERRS